MMYNENRRTLDNPKIKKFMLELNTTMKFYENSVLDDMIKDIKYKTNKLNEVWTNELKQIKLNIHRKEGLFFGKLIS